MISCTEFIPAYSALFQYLEEKRGSAEVDRYWNYLFKPTEAEPSVLEQKIAAEGIRGCYSYWTWSLNEEAADFTMYLNEKAGWFLLAMHHCPSKGRLLDLQKETGCRPYSRYCLHCDGYRWAIEKFGLGYIYNWTEMDKAACSILVYDLKVFKGKIVVDENTEIMDRRAGDNVYFHREFHQSMNRGVEYVGTNYGDAAVREYLRDFTLSFYARLIAAVRAEGLSALERSIHETYRKEQAEDVLTTKLDGDTLEVEVCACPAVRYLRAGGRTMSKWYPLTTTVVMQTIADETGYQFEMLRYDDETGAAAYRFTR